jgi:hypothetical protein
MLTTFTPLLDSILAKKNTYEEKIACSIYEKYLYMRIISDSTENIYHDPIYNIKFTSNPYVAKFGTMNHNNRRKFCRHLESFNLMLLENGIVNEFNSYTDFMNDPDLRESFGNSIIVIQFPDMKDTTEITINPETNKVLFNTFSTSDMDYFPLTKLDDTMSCVPISWI